MITLDFTDKVVIVTGANKGIGACIAEMFAEAGAKVVITGRHQEENEAEAAKIKAAGGTAIAVQLDVRDEAAVKACVQKTLDTFGGRIDILVNNAGVTDKGLIEDKSLEEWNRVLGTDLTGTFLCTREVMPIMKKQRYGRIVIISSITGKRMAYLGGCAYDTSKAAQFQFARHIGIEGAMYGITCNCVAPGSTLSPLHKTHTPPEVIAQKAKQNPMGRLGECEDQAYATLFLASDYAAYINCAEITVDGGGLYNYMDSESYHKALSKREY